MTNHSPANQDLDRFRQLMTAALDGELSGGEQTEFQQLLSASAARQEEWNEYRKLKEITMQIRFTDPPEEAWDGYWLKVYNRLERRLAWTLVSLGASVVLIFWGWTAVKSLLADAGLPWFVKTGIFALGAGLIILFISILRERLFIQKADKYREIQK